MIYLFVIIISIIIFYVRYFIISAGNYKFWKFAKRYPDQCYTWMKNSNMCWVVYEGKLPPGYANRVPSNRYSGPFAFHVPMINMPVFIFGDMDIIERSQAYYLYYVDKYNKIPSKAMPDIHEWGEMIKKKYIKL